MIPDAGEFLAGLRADYMVSVRERLAVMRALLAEARARPDAPAALHELRRLVHNLAGSGGTYGFTALSALAVEGEARLEALLAAASPPAATQFAQIETLLSGLAVALEAPAGK